ncbi:MAG TPA: DUF1116 domain-containing protein [Alphaproteobacteria bacterium]|jgi:hypothetical protein|nr:DUF1116 domain-containing protein [Alphaproteobacteria bacterium]
MSRSLLQSPPQVINVGLPGFAQDLERRGVPVVHVDWSPPHARDRRLGDAVLALSGHPIVEAANRETVARIIAGEPVLVDVRPAGEVLAGLEDRMVLHAGPPIEWNRMCGPMQGAIAGAAVLEGWAPDIVAAERLAAAGAIVFAPNHHFGAVGPMTGLTTRSMPVMIVENRTFGNRAYCTINEGLGKVMRFGGNDAAVLDRLRWIAAELGPALGATLRAAGGVPLKTIVARALSMGDEMHQRNVAATSLLLRATAPWLARTVLDAPKLARILDFISGNDQFFLNVAMALGKAMTDPARGIEGSSVVVAMSRNGTDFGVRISGTGDTWFTAPVEMPKGLYFPGFTAADANPDMGDSAIVEAIGLGGFAMAASPAVAAFVGAGGAAAALDYTRAMYEITAERNAAWTIPGLDFAGVPTGVDVRRVVESGIAPTINTGIAHRQPGIGQVGAGIVRAPLACFEQGLLALAERVGAE